MSQRAHALTEPLMSVCLSKQYSSNRIATQRRHIYLHCFAYRLQSLSSTHTPAAPAHPNLCKAKFDSRTLDRRSCGRRGNAPTCAGASLVISCTTSFSKNGKILIVARFLLCFQAVRQCQALFQGSGVLRFTLRHGNRKIPTG